MTRIAINGFGRIGRLTLKYLLNNDRVKIVAINDLSQPDTLVHLFKYDSSHGKYDGEIKVHGKEIIIDGHVINIFNEKDPSKLPWDDYGVDIVLECTGLFRTKETASMHIDAGAKKVIISAPPKSEGIKTIVLGVNEEILKDSDKIVSNASCTTNCLAPIVKILHEEYVLKTATVSTIHAYTGSQNIQDAAHKDLRRARAAAQNIIPTTTGAAKAVEMVYPVVEGKLHAMAYRVPVITGSLVEVTCLLEKEPSVEEINNTMKNYAQGDMKNILQYTEDPIVSTDIISNTYSSIFDAQLTLRQGELYKMVSWYDNEAGYSARLADLAFIVGNL